MQALCEGFSESRVTSTNIYLSLEVRPVIIPRHQWGVGVGLTLTLNDAIN